MATDPKQEQIMQLAQAIRQMGMPNPNTPPGDDKLYGWDWRPGGRNIAGEKPDPLPEHESYGWDWRPGGRNIAAELPPPTAGGKGTAIMEPPPGGYQQTFLERPSDMPDDLWNKYLARISATNQTVNLRPAGPLTSTTEEQWQQQLQPYGQGVESRYLDFARQQKGWNPAWNDYLPQLLRKLQNPDVNPTEGYVIGTQPGVYGGGRRVGIPQELWSQIAEFAKTIPGMSSREWQGPYKQPGGTPQNPYGGTQYGKQGYTEDDYSQMAERYRTDPAYKKQMDVSDYLRNAKQQEGWKPEWDAYVPTIREFLEGKIKDPRNPFEEGWQTKLRVRPIAIPEAVWNGMSNFQNKIGGIGQYRQRNPFDPYSQPFTMHTGLEPSPYPPGTAFTQPTESGQSTSVLSDLARKNAIRRQVLAKLMGRPTGANSLMDLLGQQQPY